MIQISILTIIFILFAHWVSDFLLQSDEVATTKSSSLAALMYHVFVYAISMVVLLSIFLLMPPEKVVFFCYLNGIIHFFVDFVTSKINSSLWEAEKRHWFFSMIGFDQFIHVTILLLTLSYLGKLIM